MDVRRGALEASSRAQRVRRECFGELVQIDGCEHPWFEDRGPVCTLLVFVDDATSMLLELRFVDSESTFDYFDATKAYLRRHGRPVAFYSDKHSVFRVARDGTTGRDGGVTQFGRALAQLGIDIICANTPQAKGHVERMNRTLQDRLVKELRLQGIFVELLEEGTAGWRPVRSIPLGGTGFRIAADQEIPAEEKWAFSPGEAVTCETRVFEDGVKGLAATKGWALNNRRLQRMNVCAARSIAAQCRDAARWRPRLLAAVVRSGDRSAFTAERQVVGRTNAMAFR